MRPSHFLSLSIGERSDKFNNVRSLILLFIMASGCGISRGETPPNIQEIRPGVFQLGEITFSKQNKTVTFPAKVNMRSGTLEYLLVYEEGKTHESLFSTKIYPAQLQVVMLLLGAKIPGQKNQAPPGQLDASYLKNAPKMTGAPLSIVVAWTAEGKEQQRPVDDFILKKKSPVKPGMWIYNGSMEIEGRFLAQMEGSFIALVTDPAALINNPRPGNDDDQIWSPRTEQIPPEETPVQITLKLEPEKS